MKGVESMDKSFWADLVSLAKAGYKPSDVKELLALGSSEPEKDQKDDKPKGDDNPGDETPPKKEEPKETKSAFERLAEK